MTILTTILLWSLLVCLLSWLAVKYWRFRRIVAMLNKIPGDKSHPIIGTIGSVYHKDPYEHLLLLQKEYKKFFKYGIHHFWGFYSPGVCLHRSDTIEAVFAGEKNITKATGYKFLYPWLGESLLTGSGKRWKTKRNLLTPTFHFKILEEYAPIFNKHANSLMDVFENKSAQGEKFDIYTYFVLAALDSVCESTLGKCVGALENSNNPYVTSVQGAVSCIFPRSFNPLLWPDFLFNLSGTGRKFRKCVKIMHDYTEKIIQERKANFDSNIQTNKRYQPFLDLLLNVSKGENGTLTEEDIRNEVSTFVFAGHDTTGVAMCWSTYLLGIYPEIQRKLQQELEDVLGACDRNRELTNEDVKELKYLDCVIKESLRLYPPVPSIFRVSERDYQIGEYTVPEGIDIAINIYELHRNSDVFPDPEKFDPDRFLPENCEGRPPYAYIPFSASYRNCIGQKFAMLEMKIVLAKLFMEYTVTSLTPRDQIRPIRNTILRPQNGCYVKVERR